MLGAVGYWYYVRGQIDELETYPLPGTRTELRSGLIERVDGGLIRLRNGRMVEIVHISDRTQVRELGEDSLFTVSDRSALKVGKFVLVTLDAIDDRVSVWAIDVYPAS